MNVKGEKEKRRRRERAESPHSKTTFVDYLRRVARRFDRTVRHFRVHALFFGAANAFLILINVLTGMSFPWFLFPLGGWAIVLANHYALLRQHRRQNVEVDALDELSPYQADALRRFHRQRTAFSLTLTSAASSALFLVMTNIIVSPHFAWAAITAGALGLGVLGHYVGYGSARARLIERIGARLDEGRRLPGVFSASSRALRMSRGPGGVEAVSAELRGARELKERIEVRLKGVEALHGALETEIRPLLDRYVEQIAALIAGSDEIAGLTGRETFDSLRIERDRLLSRQESARTPVLEAEYRRAIAQLDSRMASLQRLREQNEVAALRVGSALHSLEQLETEIVRLRTQSDIDGSAVSQMVERKVEELSAYVADFEQGRRELEAE